MTRILAVLAFLFFGAFLLILCIEVPSPDLIAVSVLTLVLAGVDILRSALIGPKSNGE